MPRRLSATVTACLAILLVALGVGSLYWDEIRDGVFSRDVPGPGPIEARSAGFVGSQACADCHREIWEKYQRHPMARSMASIDSATPIEDYREQTEFHHPATRQYRVEHRNGQTIHHEAMFGADGAVLYDQGVPMQWVLGSGTRGRSYLFERDGVLYVSPISWFTASHRWDIAPGYEPLEHQRFERRVTDNCMTCHAGRMNFDRRWPDRFGAPLFQELTIGCERCHGPGEQHVRFQTDGPGAGQDNIIHPGQLEAGPREDLCNHCHLAGDRRIVRQGKSWHDFQAGMRLEDVWVTFVRGAHVSASGASRAVSQVQQMRSSRCFQESAGRFGCTSCHDPHSVPEAETRVDYFNGRCLTCHAERGCALPEPERLSAPESNSCIACHMPSLSATNVSHTAQTDHRVLRRPNEPRTGSSPDWELFDGADARLPALEVERAQILTEISFPEFRQSAADLARLTTRLTAVLQAEPDDATGWVDLGNLALMQKHPEEAERCWRRALELQPWEERALKPLANLLAQRQEWNAAIRLARRRVRSNPWLADGHTLLAQYLDDAGRTEEALREVEQALEINPTLIPDRSWLAATYRRLGRIAEAEREELRLQEMHGR